MERSRLQRPSFDHHASPPSWRAIAAFAARRVAVVVVVAIVILLLHMWGTMP